MPWSHTVILYIDSSKRLKRNFLVLKTTKTTGTLRSGKLRKTLGISMLNCVQLVVDTAVRKSGNREIGKSGKNTMNRAVVSLSIFSVVGRPILVGARDLSLTLLLEKYPTEAMGRFLTA